VAEAAVVGGGIGGLAAARALQLAGWSVQVFEQAGDIEPVGAGISLWPNAVRALGLLQVSLHQSRPVRSGGLRSRDGRSLSAPSRRATRPGTARRWSRCTAACCCRRCSTPCYRAP